MNREQMVDKMVKQDIEDISRWISEGNTEFLDSVLRGYGWTGYSQLTDEQVINEYDDREFESEEN
jgi:hypothetical protein